VNLDRRSFLIGSVALAASLAAPEVIPFNRKWFFPLNFNFFKNLWRPETTLNAAPILPKNYSISIPFTAEELGAVAQPNQLLSISYINRETLRILIKELQFTQSIEREYDEAFLSSITKGYGSINIRKPLRYVKQIVS